MNPMMMPMMSQPMMGGQMPMGGMMNQPMMGQMPMGMGGMMPMMGGMMMPMMMCKMNCMMTANGMTCEITPMDPAMKDMLIQCCKQMMTMMGNGMPMMMMCGGMALCCMMQ